MPSPAAIRAYYSRDYWAGRPIIGKVINAEHYCRRADAQIAFVKEFLPMDGPLDVLEIGAGSAMASLRLRENFWRRVSLYVCEPGLEWTDYYAEHGITRIADFFPFTGEKQFHYIHTSHWLEHTLEMRMTTRAIWEALRPEGHVFVEVPNTGHDYWKLGIPGTPHTHFFTPVSLRAAFVVAGFLCVRLGEFGLTMRAWQEGAKPGEGDYGARPGGMWIRAVFQKPMA